MCMIELATKTITADSRMGAHSEVSGTIFPSVRGVVYAHRTLPGIDTDYVRCVSVKRRRRTMTGRKAAAAGWPIPVWPPPGSPLDVKREWQRLHKRLRWALRMEADVVSNVRPGAKLARLRAGAKQRNLAVQLTLAEYVELTEGGRCHYCDGPLPESGHGLDRKNTDLGYSRGNVVMACDACN